MYSMQSESLQYSILDPTGNITALVESAIAADRQPAAAAELMKRHPEVEQVGFVRFAYGDDPALPELRMAGGEFCGNAAMSAAALYLFRRQLQSGQAPAASIAEYAPETVWLRVSGAAQPVEVCLRQEAADSFSAGVRMPPPLGISETEFVFGNLCGKLPLVRMEGISHVVIEPDSVFFALRGARKDAEQAVREWCGTLAADGLGLMFLEGNVPVYRLTPLVYIPGSGTVFWETSCASGSAAVGMVLAARTGTPVSLELQEPGGRLRVESEQARGETWLYGNVRILAG